MPALPGNGPWRDQEVLMKRTEKKLKLAKETLRNLEAAALGKVGGGTATEAIGCGSNVTTCSGPFVCVNACIE
jgi:hypothetical protein